MSNLLVDAVLYPSNEDESDVLAVFIKELT
jgi:hypothetical protein